MKQVIAILDVSPIRRISGVGILLALSAVLVYVAVASPPTDILAAAVLVGVAAVVVWQGIRLYQATGKGLVLTIDGLFETDGTPVCSLDQIASVDRSFFAFKPSNGFLIRLKKPMPRAWAPGLWWRFGRRIGVGGATSARQGRAMADILAALLTEQGREILTRQWQDDADDEAGES